MKEVAFKCQRCCQSQNSCSMDCIARQEKFAMHRKKDAEGHCDSFQYEVVRVSEGYCGCVVCSNFQPFTVEWDDGQPMANVLPWCKALRGRQYQGLDIKTMVSTRFPDTQICRLCFDDMWSSIAALLFTELGTNTDHIVLARASKFSWQETLDVESRPPHHYLQSLESGDTKLEEAVLHIGRHWACHGNAPCNVVSTSKLFAEAMRRLSDGFFLHVVCVPLSSVQSIASDMSSVDSFNEGTEMEECCLRHKVPMDTVQGFGVSFKEVCLSRHLLKQTPGIIAIEIPAETCKDLTGICSQAFEHFHCDALQFLDAEMRCRKFAIDAIQRRLAVDNADML
jgi:hypothetical protein